MPVVSAREERRHVRRVARERRAVERDEVKRFTRHARTRRFVVLTAVGIVAGLGALLAVAVFSPILSLREVSVEGTNRVDSAEVRAAIEGQLGSPLALLDFARIESDLANFPLIRSYVTQTIPPSTLVVRIIEREPLGVVATAGGFDVVDAAGIVVESTTEVPSGVPLIILGSQNLESEAFAAISEVLLSLPPNLLAQVDSIGANTRDDVTFTMRGVGQSVVWGSADRSAFKARVLAAMILETDSSLNYEFDISAPESVVVTPR
ncbi:MAG: FtsQ-type POTRA domain-containing protein [Microbacteriaceae bacterium]